MSISRKLIEAAAGSSDDAAPFVDDVFSTYVYKGTGVGQTIENGIDLDGEGGLVWIKRRDAAYGHVLIDTERGGNSSLDSSNNGPPQIDYAPITFNSDGFTCTASKPNYNGVQSPYVSWAFRKARKFFDVITYKADNNGLTLSHNLGVEPGMIIIKNTSTGGKDWYVYHKSLGHTKSLALNNDTKEGGSSEMVSPPTDKTFTLSGVNGTTCVEPYEYVAYLFAHDDSDEGMIQCGSFSHAYGTPVTIDLGWEPQFVLVKSASATGSWFMVDTMRGWTASTDDRTLWADDLKAEADQYMGEPTSTGFIWPSTQGNPDSADTQDYIYMAIRRPNKLADEFEPEELFAVNSLRQEPDPGWIAGFPTDFSLHKTVNETGGTQAQSRPTGTGRLFTDQDSAEGPINANLWDYMDGNRQGNGVANSNELQWMWRRAPGFFDVVTYEGDAATPINHNLGVAPEMMWVRDRNPGTSPRGNWNVYHKDLGAEHSVFVNETKPSTSVSSGIGLWNNKEPTDSVFYTGYTNEGYQTGSFGQPYIAYLFASVPGICDIGTYDGTGKVGQEVLIPSFTGWVRYLLIKRTDGNGNWWQTVTPGGYTTMIQLNSTAAQEKVSAVAPLGDGRGGFQLTTNDAEFNASGGKYIYYAIA